MKLLGYATIIKANGQINLVARYAPFKLETLQSLVGGYIEVIPTHDGRLMVVNEEGKCKENAEINLFATKMTAYDYIVGDVVVCEKNLLERSCISKGAS